MDELTISTQDEEIVLNNVPFRVNGDIGFEIANIYARPIRQGDPEPADHPVDSTITQESHQGGIGTLRYKGDEDRGNCWFSTLWMMTNNTLSLPPRSDEYSVGDDSEDASLAFVHDRIVGSMIVTFGQKLKRWNESTDQFDDPGSPQSLISEPVGGGVTWGNKTTPRKVYIPQGPTYQTFDGSTVGSGPALEGAIDFCVFEQKLFKLDANGDVKFTVDGSSWDLKGTIPTEFRPRRLFVFYNKGGDYALHVSTSGAVYALDFANEILQETDFSFPDHPFQGYGATRWRADAYVSVGIGVHRNTQGLISAVGPDGRDGLPEDYASGYFTDLYPAYNDMFGLIRGVDLTFTPHEETSDLEMPPPQTFYSEKAPGTYAMLLAYNILGWHPRWIGTREPTNVKVFSQESTYRVMWGTRGRIYTQKLPTGYYNPTYVQHSTPLERFGEHLTPYYNWGFVDTPKIIKYFELKSVGCDEKNYITIDYRIDDSQDWQTLTPDGIRTNGQQRLLIGFQDIGGTTLHVGLAHERIQFRFRQYGDPDNPYATPSISWYSLVGRKWMRAVRVFNLSIDCSTPYKGRSERQLSDELFIASRKKGGVPLVIGDELFVVDVTTNAGNIEAGETYSAMHSISCVEMIEEDNE